MFSSLFTHKYLHSMIDYTNKMCYKSYMDTIKHIFEPNPLACGQAVIAMIANADVNDVINLVGTERETTFNDMKTALKHFGLSLSQQRLPVTGISDLPEVALLSLETPKCWHWSLYAFGKVYDPEFGVLPDFPVSNRKYFWEITKFNY